MSMIIAEAKRTRKIIEQAMQSLPDDVALTAVKLYPEWEDLCEIGSVEHDVGFRFHYGDKLFACVNVNPTFQKDWVPGVDTASLYTEVCEDSSGTINDPIPYEGNMILVNGLYYTQNGIVYLCNRDTGVAVYNALSDLIGLYVEVVS